MSDETRNRLRAICVRMALDTGDEEWLKVETHRMFYLFGDEEITPTNACKWLRDNYYEPSSVPV